MILGAEIGMLIYGLYVLVTGRYRLGKGREIVGGKARILGILSLLPIPVSFVAGLLLGFVYAFVIGELPSPWLSTGMELVILLTIIGVIYFLGRTFYQQQEMQNTPGQQHGNQYEYGPYTNYEAFEPNPYNGPRDDTGEAYLASLEEPASRNTILGMSPMEIVILGILVIIICALGGFVGLNFLNNSTAPETVAVVLPTSTFVPTLTPIPTETTTPLVKSTPIPGWSRFEFSYGKAEIWLPSSYQGGDTVAYPEIVAMTIDTFLSDEVFKADAKEMIKDPNMALFAFDTASTDIIRFMSVYYEKIPTNVELTMDAYLDMTLSQMQSEGMQVTDRYLTSLDYYHEVGVIIFENSVPLGEGISLNVKLSLHAIRVGDEVWGIFFRTGRDEFDSYFPTIDSSVRSFSLKP